MSDLNPSALSMPHLNDQNFSVQEEQRLQKLYTCGILDTPEETVFQHIAEDVAFALNMPLVMVNFVDRNRVWSKVRLQAEPTLPEGDLPREHAFCSYTILSDDALVVPDMLQDSRFNQNPLVTGGPQVRFYAGVPLISKEGHRLGTVCCMDQHPRDFSERDLEHLKRAARRVNHELELYTRQTEHQQMLQEMQILMSASPSGFLLLDQNAQVLDLNPAVCTITGMNWKVGEHFEQEGLLLDDRLSIFEPIYARWRGTGWYTITRVKVPQQNHALLVFEDVTDHVQWQASLQERLDLHPVTGLYNRNAFHSMLEAALDQGGLAVAFLELEGLDRNLEGTPAGEALLREMARRLRQTVRLSDQVFHLETRGFALILRGEVTPEVLHGIAHRVLHSVQVPFMFEGQQVAFGLKLGITRPRAEDSADALLSRTGQMVYAIKGVGKGHFN
ncbi:sensor domain-containing diguanylate cyclase [Deinococcus roseus]|uniref:GGDEF domain-containing protein n=1 Tax=Deinococcus roseus TaxID=392414 RepID=A0ABQ2D5W8_9DEIO|nr:sensor domain-containing diguanylate cyclase [Deinococcus roseus]GGJ47080.1 hypothetical protein GCM10008938_36440 [Deinococcus roseus]